MNTVISDILTDEPEDTEIIKSLNKLETNSSESEEQREHKKSAEQKNSLLHYLKFSNSIFFLIFLLLIFLIAQIVGSSCDYWIRYWTEQENLKYQKIMVPSNSSLFFDIIFLNNNTVEVFKTNVSIYIYTGLIISVIFLTMLKSVIFFHLFSKISNNIHRKMTNCILYTPLRFFEKSNTGQILNRFSKDMCSVDEFLPEALYDSIQIILMCIGLIINISLSSTDASIASLILLLIVSILSKSFMNVGRKVKRLESESIHFSLRFH